MAVTIREIVLAILEVIAIASCGWGMYCIYEYSTTPVSMGYNSLWFICGIVSNLAGITSILFFNFDSDEEMNMAHMFLQIHYLVAWFCVVIGYQSLVANMWMVYTGSYYGLLHSLLSLLPLIAWYMHKTQFIVVSTQAITALGLASQFYISWLAKNDFGMIGAGLMVANIVALSLPTRFKLLGITSREGFIIGLGIASYVFALTVEEMTRHPNSVSIKNLIPW